MKSEPEPIKSCGVELFRKAGSGAVHQIAKASGFRLVREPQSIADSIKQAIPEASETDRALISEALIISMTGPERLWALLQSVRYLEANEISGDFVECGVWKGGSSFLMAKALQMLGGQTEIFGFSIRLMEWWSQPKGTLR